MLYNEQEDAIDRIVDALAQRGVSLHYWRRDVAIGDSLNALEEAQFTAAPLILVLLGARGWEPQQQRLADRALTEQRRMLLAVIGDPPAESLQWANGYFQKQRYADLRKTGPRELDYLAEAIRRRRHSGPAALDAIIGGIINGNEEQRSNLLQQITTKSFTDTAALAARLRDEITGRFAPGRESAYGSAVRDPKLVPSIRAWMLSFLIWSEPESEASRAVVLKHVSHETESDRNVRFWALAGLYQVRAAYLGEAVAAAVNDPAPEVRLLARAIASSSEPSFENDIRADLTSDNFEVAWPVLRVLRVVPLTWLAATVALRLVSSSGQSDPAYDAIYALASPAMARAAAPVLFEHLGVDGTVRRVIEAGLDAAHTTIARFAEVLVPLDATAVDAALRAAAPEPRNGAIAAVLRTALERRTGARTSRPVFMAGFHSDAVEEDEAQDADELDIQQDVQTLTAVMLSTEVRPPLAVGLFGDWGTGKSYFMRAMRRAARALPKSLGPDGKPRFCERVVPVEFNAWHYVDTNLWASLVSRILERLAAVIAPKPTPEEAQSALLAELASARAVVQEIDKEKEALAKLSASQQEALGQLRRDRLAKELQLGDLRARDLQQFVEESPELKAKLDELGLPALMKSVADLDAVAAEARSVGGKAGSVLAAMFDATNRGRLYPLLVLALIVIPALAGLVRHFELIDTALASITAAIAQIVTIAAGVIGVARKSIGVVKQKLTKIVEVQKSVQAFLDEKRKTPSKREKDLERELGELQIKEQEAITKLSVVTARVTELENKLRVLQEGRSLARFVVERASSEDYRKHMGLISTIREDFQTLSARLAHPPDDEHRVDRIVLYIDDLDRCPADKVMEVLQAVHLLLAYPLFVVVVGVDPRWLLHSLEESYSAFQSDRPGSATQRLWQTTPQNYLEKIFQIPFNLRPMSEGGYQRLMRTLMSSSTEATVPKERPADVAAAQRSNHPAPQGRPDTAAGAPQETAQQPQEPATIVPSPQPRPAESRFQVNEEALTISEPEMRFVGRLYALMPSPRAATRFSNVYRILKAPIQRDQLALFEGTSEVPGSFQIPMLLLAIVIGAPALATSLFPAVFAAARAGKDPRGVFDALHERAGDDSARCILEVIDDPQFPQFPQSANLYVEWIPRVARFSFETGRTIERPGPPEGRRATNGADAHPPGALRPARARAG
ncbi:MAG TPA: P-loop NTPase fold protein [Kofleriaceae bacterium]